MAARGTHAHNTVSCVWRTWNRQKGNTNAIKKERGRESDSGFKREDKNTKKKKQKKK
jgi:hypothetical protein